MLAKAIADDKELNQTFGNPKYASITKKIMEEPTLLLLDDPMSRIEVSDGDEALRPFAKDLIKRLQVVVKPAGSGSEEDESLEGQKTPSDRSATSSPPPTDPPKSSQKQGRNTFSPTGSESSASVIESRQTIQKKRPVRRVPRKKKDIAEEEVRRGELTGYRRLLTPQPISLFVAGWTERHEFTRFLGEIHQ